jgi:branched-chain amino acid transport system substrate-binding protein
MKTTRLVLLACLCLAGLLFGGCKREKSSSNPVNEPQAAESQPIKLGAILSLTGSAAQYGKWSQNGIELALSEVNQAGGINGRQLQIIYEDDGTDPASAVSAAQKLISIDHVSAIIGPLTSSSVLAAAPVAEANHTVLLSPCASSPKITGAGQYIFRNWPSDNFEGGAMAEFLANQLHAKTVVVAAMNNEYGLGLKGVFIHRATELGLKILDVLSFEQGATDLRAQAARIAELKPDVVYAPGHGKEVATLIRQCREIGVKSVFASSVAFESPDVFTVAGSAADGTYYTAPAFNPDSENSVVKKFREAYEARYHAKPEVFAAHAYDAVNILSTALRDAGGDASKLKDALHAIHDFAGIAGNTTFDKNGDVIQPVAVKVTENGKFVLWQKTQKAP